MRVLVCNIGAAAHEGFDGDAAVYRKYYDKVDILAVRLKSELFPALQSGYEIVHMFSRCSQEGVLSDLADGTLAGTELIRLCSGSRTKLLWIAAANPSASYINGFRAKGSTLNLIMTLDRKGDQFAFFLGKLLSRLSSGEKLPHAWTALAPQKGGPPTSDLPDCIFFAPGPPLSLPR
ncbi:MAG TPA: hypothetical protein VMB03_02075 [Bryobacteraceae bacterium]|nr:hypothetical protein [Bryobacteraceae bacterium]